MNKIVIKQLGMDMDLYFAGKLNNLTNSTNGMLFELLSSEVIISAYLQDKPKEGDLVDFIKMQLQLLKQQDYSTHKTGFFKDELGDLTLAKTSLIKPIKTQFKNSYAVVVHSKGINQMQFYIEVDNFIMIIGLIVSGKDFSSNDEFVRESVFNLIKSIDSLKKI